MKSFLRKLGWLLQWRRKEDELRDELQFHLDEEAEERRAQGLTDAHARMAARRELGNVALVQEDTRATWTWMAWEQFLQDVRYGLRAMAANKTFSALVILSLALGIGANTAIYSFLDALLLRSLPVADPESLALLNWHSRPRQRSADGEPPNHVLHSMSGSTYDDAGGMTSGIFPYGAFELLKQNDAVFSSVFAYHPTGNRTLNIKGQAEQARGEYVSGDYFRGLAVPPAAGRLIVPDDDRVGAPPVVVLSADSSQARFGGAAQAVGQPVLIDHVPFTVVGVVPPEFFGVDPAAAPRFYVPLHTDVLLDAGNRWGATAQSYQDQNYYWLEIMARLRPGVSHAQAQAALAGPFHQWVTTTATNERERASLPVLDVKEGGAGLDTLRRQYSKPLYVLLTIVGLILAIACANTANLLLARAAARSREMAVRLSMGAGRLRVMRQLLTESVLLASLGGAAGIVVAFWGMRSLTLLMANGRQNFTMHAELNWHVLGAALALSLLCGVLFGLAPAIQATRPDVMPALKERRATSSPARAGRGVLRVSLSRVFVVSQIAISLLMLVAASLFVRTLSNLESVQLGFNRENILLFDVNARQAGHQDPEIASFYSGLTKQLAALPGVRNATLAHSSLLGAGRQMPIRVDGKPTPGTRILNTGPAFFTTMQIPMLLGRQIDDRDQPRSTPVAVVNELFAKKYFGDRNPVGRHITFGEANPRDMEIVGVSANVRYGSLKEPFWPIVYIPYNQGDNPPINKMTFALRTTGNPLLYVDAVRRTVRQADAGLPVTDVKTQAAEVDESMIEESAFAKFCTAFAVLALVIACVGLYGTTAYSVARRTGEIGIRMALGAQRRAVMWMVLREVLTLMAVGLAISLPAALGATKFIQSFLFGMKANDPRALAAAVAVLVAAALLAGFIPARKASRIDPLSALRHE